MHAHRFECSTVLCIQYIILDDLFTVKDLNDLLKSCSLLSGYRIIFINS